MSLSSLCVRRVIEAGVSVPEFVPEDLLNELLDECLKRGVVSMLPGLLGATKLCLMSRTINFDVLPKFSRLSSVVLHGNVPDSAAAAIIDGCGACLRELEIKSPILSDKSFVQLAKRALVLEKLGLDGCKGLTVATVAECLSCEGLTALSCGEFQNLSNLIDVFDRAECSHLLELNFAAAKGVTKELLSVVARKFAFLSRLSLRFCFRLTSLEPLLSLAHLVHLDISGCPGVVLPEKPFPALCSFKAEFCDSLNDVSKLPLHLSLLDIGSLRRLPHEPTLAFVCRLSHLNRVRIQCSDFFFRDGFLESLSRAGACSLAEIQLSPCLVGSAGMMALAACSNLEILHLPGPWCEANDESIRLLATSCQNLRSISLGKQEQATDAAFLSMGALKELELLDLSLHSLSSAALANTALNRKIRCISLRYCKNIDGGALMSLIKCRELQSLDVSHTTLTFADLVSFAHRACSITFLNATGLAIDRHNQRTFNEKFPNIHLYL